MSKQPKKVGRVKAALLTWLGVPIGLADEAFWESWSANKNAAGQDVNQGSVMSLSAAWACTRLISETIATLPIKLYERTPDGRRAATEHPLYQIISRSPNASTAASTYWESSVAAMLLNGNSLSEKQFLGGRLVGIKFLAPHRLSGSKNSKGVAEIRYTEADGTQRVIEPSRIFHVPGFSLDGKNGVSAISYGANVFGSALAASTAANSTFEKGLSPTVAFTTERIIKKEQRDDFRESIKDIRGAINAGESPLLEGGMDAKVLSINPADAQLLESRNFSVEEVCRWFRVDPSMVGHGGKDSNWGTGLEQKMISFLTFTLRPWLTRIEQYINKELLSPVDQMRYYAEFSIEGLLRADSAARAAFYSVMVNNGIMTRDEVRALENLTLMGGNANVLTVQTAMAPLDTIGVNYDGDTGRAALAAWLKQQEATDGGH